MEITWFGKLLKGEKVDTTITEMKQTLSSSEDIFNLLGNLYYICSEKFMGIWGDIFHADFKKFKDILKDIKEMT